MEPLVALAGERVVPLLAPDATVRLGVARTSGPVRGRTDDAVAWLVVEAGRGSMTVDGSAVEVDGRADVFERAGWSALLGPHSEFALDGPVDATIVWRPTDRAIGSRIIDPETVETEDRGDGTTARHVRTYAPEGPLIVGETLNPPGGWSSWPPHRHDAEEIYLYRFAPAHGFGIHVGYDDDGDHPTLVRDGAIQRISAGWHPVVAAPGFAMYYLWAIAGDTDTVVPETQPGFS